MLFSTKAEYGVRVMVHLARHSDGEAISLTDEAQAIRDHGHEKAGGTADRGADPGRRLHDDLGRPDVQGDHDQRQYGE